MSNFGAQIYNEKGFYSSPEYMPIVLCGVIDASLADLPVIYHAGGLGTWSIRSGRKVKTAIPNDVVLSVFYRCLAYPQDSAPALYFEPTPGDDGFQDIFVWPTDGRKATYRFYIFANYLLPSSIPDWGVFFHKNNEIIYHGNCLPLQIHFFPDAPNTGSTNLPQGKSFAVMSTFYMHVSSAVLHTDLWFSWTATSQRILTGPFWAEGKLSGQAFDNVLSWQGVFYIETELYDQYYKQSLGYA